MENDFRKEFDKLRPKIKKRWLILFILVISFLPFSRLIYYFSPNILGGKYILFVYIAMVLYVNYFLLRIECPNCKKDLYVSKYIWEIPIIIQGMIEDHCQHCGAWLKGKEGK